MSQKVHIRLHSHVDAFVICIIALSDKNKNTRFLQAVCGSLYFRKTEGKFRRLEQFNISVLMLASYSTCLYCEKKIQPVFMPTENVYVILG